MSTRDRRNAAIWRGRWADDFVGPHGGKHRRSHGHRLGCRRQDLGRSSAPLTAAGARAEREGRAKQGMAGRRAKVRSAFRNRSTPETKGRKRCLHKFRLRRGVRLRRGFHWRCRERRLWARFPLPFGPDCEHTAAFGEEGLGSDRAGDKAPRSVPAAEPRCASPTVSATASCAGIGASSSGERASVLDACACGSCDCSSSKMLR